MRVLGIDYGAKRVGIALGDTESRIASPWSVLSNDGTEKLIDEISEIMDREDAPKVIVGLPVPLVHRDHPTEQTEEVQVFIDALKGAGLDVEAVDEALSSKLAAIFAREAGHKEKRDDLAAATILQTWLDRKK